MMLATKHESELPRVSIVIPVFNGANYLSEAIESALSQTYSNVEVIVVNDGSNDGGATATICKRFGDRIRYFEKENGGVGSALNVGLSEMTGDYFSWLSHDDLHFPKKAETQVAFLRAYPTEKLIPIANYEVINDRGEITGNFRADLTHYASKPLYTLLRGAINGCSAMIPREVFDDVGDFDESLAYVQDYDMWRRLIRCGYEFRFMPDVLSATRVHSKQATKLSAATEEATSLWISMMDDTTVEERAGLEGNSVKYYAEMEKFLESTPYERAMDHAHRRAVETNAETLVSFIIPFRNRTDLTTRSIHSALGQSHRSIEVVVVDDGSSEDTSEVRHLANIDERVRLIQQPPLGLSAARNRAMSEARGDYFAFLDSDDLSLPNRISGQLWYMQVQNAVISHGDYLRVHGEEPASSQLVNVSRFAGKVFPTILANCPIHPSTVMVNRCLYDAGELRFDTQLTVAEDIIAWASVVRKHDLVAYAETLSLIFINQNSAAFHIERQIEGLEILLEFIRSEPGIDADGKITSLHMANIKDLKALSAQGIRSTVGKPEKEARRAANTPVIDILAFDAPPHDEASLDNGAARPAPDPSPASHLAVPSVASPQSVVAIMGERNELARQLEMIRKSTSWRITGPLRRAVRILRGR